MSTSNPNLDVCEDEEDQLCPDDPQRLKQQQQLVCPEALDSNVSFSLEHLDSSVSDQTLVPPAFNISDLLNSTNMKLGAAVQHSPAGFSIISLNNNNNLVILMRDNEVMNK